MCMAKGSGPIHRSDTFRLIADQQRFSLSSNAMRSFPTGTCAIDSIFWLALRSDEVVSPLLSSANRPAPPRISKEHMQDTVQDDKPPSSAEAQFPSLTCA